MNKQGGRLAAKFDTEIVVGSLLPLFTLFMLELFVKLLIDGSSFMFMLLTFWKPESAYKCVKLHKNFIKQENLGLP